jgi:hypothetical protein
VVDMQEYRKLGKIVIIKKMQNGEYELEGILEIPDSD